MPEPQTEPTSNSPSIEENQRTKEINIQTSTSLEPRDPQELVNLDNKNQTISTEKASTQKLESPLRSTTYATTKNTTTEAIVQNVTSSK